MWSESQGAALSTCWGRDAEKPWYPQDCPQILAPTGLSPDPGTHRTVPRPWHPQDCPQTQPRGKTGHAVPSHFGAVHGLHFPEPVLWEIAAYENIIFIYQVLLLQHVLGWGQ